MISVFLLILFDWRHCAGYGFYGGPTRKTPESADIIEAHNLTSWISNYTTRAMLMQYLVLCPEQDMCHGQSLRRSYVFDVGMTRACTPCDCDASCISKSSCCPSKYLRMENGSDPIELLEQNKTISLNCSLPILNIHSDFQGQSYWMVDSCPDGKVCIPSNSHSINVSLFTPVTSLLTNETYRYLQCALCNDENISDLLFWKQDQIVCTSRSYLLSTMLTPDAIYQKIFDKLSPCNILFYPPNTIRELVTPCISTTGVPCNQTGSLDGNASYLIQACNDYYLPFITNHKTYKNIFCALCFAMPLLDLPIENKEDTGYGGSKDFPLFSALINFNKKRSVDEFHNDVECAPGQMYYKQLKTCFALTCEQEHEYTHHPPEPPSCQSFFSTWEENNYEINLIFEKIGGHNSTAFLSVGTLLKTHLENKLLTNKLSDYLCSLNIFGLDERTDTEQFGALIELTVNRAHNLNDMIKYMLNLFAKDKEVVLEDTYSGLNITFSSFLIGQRFLLYEEDRHMSLFARHYVHPLSYQTKYSLAFIDMASTRRFCLKSLSTVVVADWYTCPKVRISTEDTLISLKNFSLCLPELNTCIPSRYFKKSTSNLQYDICLDWFNRAQVTASQSSADLEESKYLSLVCLSLSTAGSVLTIISYIVRSSPLVSPGSHIVVLSFFITFANIIYTISKFFVWSKSACITAGVFVHFFWLSSMFWMSLSSFKIFQTFTDIATFRKKSKVSTLLLVNFFLCLFFIGVNISVSYYSSGGNSFGYSTSTCYIADPNMILYTFALPVGISVSINTFMFLVTVNKIFQKEDVRRSREQQRVSAYFRLSTLTGASWCFGFLAQITNLEVFSFLHTVFSGGQGVLLYFAFGLPLWVNGNPGNKRNMSSN